MFNIYIYTFLTRELLNSQQWMHHLVANFQKHYFQSNLPFVIKTFNFIQESTTNGYLDMANDLSYSDTIYEHNLYTIPVLYTVWHVLTINHWFVAICVITNFK